MSFSAYREGSVAQAEECGTPEGRDAGPAGRGGGRGLRGVLQLQKDQGCGAVQSPLGGLVDPTRRAVELAAARQHEGVQWTGPPSIR
jgi:hypothetical protein